MTDTTKDREDTRHKTSEDTAQSECNGLLDCPDCGRPAKDFCKIDIIKARETHDKNNIQAKCSYCGFSVTLVTTMKPAMIRRYWSVR